MPPRSDRSGVGTIVVAVAGHDEDVQISARGDYAVRAALSLAQSHPALMSAQAIAQDQQMPRKFLEAVLADLRRAGVVRAQRGAEGGYTLSQSPRDVTIGQILRAVDGPLAGVRGLRPEETKYSGAAENLPNLWVAVRAAVREVVDEVSLADLISGRLPAHVRKLTTRPDAWQPR
jgi:Rrf2 family protein